MSMLLKLGLERFSIHPNHCGFVLLPTNSSAYNINEFLLCLQQAFLAQLGERQTEDLKVSCSIHEEGIAVFLLFCHFRHSRLLFCDFFLFSGWVQKTMFSHKRILYFLTVAVLWLPCQFASYSQREHSFYAAAVFSCDCFFRMSGFGRTPPVPCTLHVPCTHEFDKVKASHIRALHTFRFFGFTPSSNQYN